MLTDKNFCYLGGCRCGNVSIELSLPEILSNFVPRACDCNFCTEREITYPSDPQGQLVVSSLSPLKTLKQGSNQASFKHCPNCHEVICVAYRFENNYKGALNIRLLDKQSLLPQAQTVSPKELSPQQKLVRWKSVWLSVVIEKSSQP